MLAGSPSWMAALLVLAGCTTLAGLDADYTLGDPAMPAASGSVTSASSVSAGGSVASSGIGGAATGTAVGGSGGGSTGGAGGSTIVCNDQYGGIMGYIFCAETTTTCDFQALLNSQSSCGEQCANAGGECIEAYANGRATCNHNSVVGCAYGTATDLVCLCSRGCGGGPPCTTGQQCNNGSCM